MYGMRVEIDIVKANGINIAYESFGSPDCECILLIAGIGSQLVNKSIQLIEELVKHGYRIVFFDNHDVGHSTNI